MHSLHNRGVHSENLRILPNYAPNKMDYRQKMVVPNAQNFRHEDEDDEDLEALRMAALKSLRVRSTIKTSPQKVLLQQSGRSETARYPAYPVYCQQRQTKRGYYQNRLPRHNGNLYYPSRLNQNLIEIIPVQQDKGLKDAPQHDQRTAKRDAGKQKDTDGDSKFCRFSDDASDSEEEDTKGSNSTSAAAVTSKSERLEKGDPEGDDSGTERDVQSGFEESPGEENASEASKDDNDAEEGQLGEDEEEDEQKPSDEDDDDDILLMADLEEQNSLERLMDEMEREMKPSDQKNAKSSGSDARDAAKPIDAQKPPNKTSRTERPSEKNGLTCAATPVSSSSVPPKSADATRPPSPRPTNRPQQIHRSLSPKPRPRKKSPRRSPRRSPARQIRKLSREAQRPRSPRKSPPSGRYSPRLSPRRSPNRSPARRPSPRGRSPHSRSPRIRRSRSPRPISRSRSPRSLRSPKRSNRSRSPRNVRSMDAPRLSPPRVSPRTRSPPRARSPCRISIRSRTPPRDRSPRRSKSPRISPNDRPSPPRRASPRRAPAPRPRSPKMSPERRRASPAARMRSPGRLSPQRSPWDSPRNSPRLSPRRRRSPKDSSRKNRPTTPIEKSSASYKREPSLSRKTAASPEPVRSKAKQPQSGRAPAKDASSTDDPVLEARKRKFESNKLIDPVNDNKKIKLSKRETTSKKEEPAAPREAAESPKMQKSCEALGDEYVLAESDLCLTDDYVYEVLEDVASDQSSGNNAVAVCVEVVPVKAEKVRSKKKRKRDKEIYQAGKAKGELPLSERIGKEKKCKKRKDKNSSAVESSPESAVTNPVEDLTVDEEGDLRTELSRRRAERLSRAAPVQSARLLQSAFKGVVKEVAKTNAKVIQRHAAKGEEKNSKKEVRRVTVLHRQVADLPDSEEETVVDSKVPVRFRLGRNKPASQDSRETKAARKSSKRPGRKVKHKNNMSLTDHERKKQ